MGYDGGKACAECTHRCLSLHGDNSKNPCSDFPVTTFFKIMIGDNFSNVMYLPPKFAQTVPALIGQNIDLEDVNGRRWRVTVAIVNRSICFQQGWHDFSLDHGLEVGDFLLFRYVTGSHFFVQIYDQSACQKFFFSDNNSNQKKSTLSNRDHFAEVGLCQTSHKGSVDKQGSYTSVVSKSENEITQWKPHGNDVGKTPIATEKPSICANVCVLIKETDDIFDRDVRSTERDRRSALFDLSAFEMPLGNSKILAEKERSPRSQTEAGLVHKDSLADIGGKKIDFQVMDKVLHMPQKDSGNGILVTRSAVEPAKHGNDSSATPNLVIKECQNAKGESNTDSIEAAKRKQEEMIEESRHGKKPKIINEGGQSRGLNVTEDDKVNKVVKSEPVDSCDFSPTDAIKVSCLVVSDDQTYLELPTCLPSISKGKMKLGRKIVLLRDPVSRLWPLIYHDNYSFRILASGWVTFCKGNNIRAGDECVFELESLLNCIYKVGIIRK